MTKFSKKQRLAQNLINELVEKFGKDRWFIQAELKGITLHSMNALVLKNWLDKIYHFEQAYYRLREPEEK
jgi:hypothetical protein